MRQLRGLGVAAALLGAGAPAVAADARPWYKKMFASSPPPAGPTVRSGPVAPARPGVPTATLPPDVVREAVKAEADALLRRMDVCLALRQAAHERNDDALMRQADELERQAKAVYEARVAALGVSKGLKAPLPVAPAVGVASLDLAPETGSDPKAAAARLVAPAAPVPVSGTASTGGDVRTVSPEGP